MAKLFVFLAIFFVGMDLALAAGSGITYHGRLLRPDGAPVLANTQFKIQIRTPGTENCLMFEEQQSKDLSTTNGMFSITINDGSGTRQDANAWSLNQVFANRQTFSFNPSDCNAITTYTPGAADGRSLKVFFNDGSFAGWEPMPTQSVNFVPMAIESYSTGGFTAKSLLRVEDGATLGNVSSLTTANFNELMALILGTSSQYTKAGQLNGSALPAMTNGQTLGWNGSAWSAVTPLTSESDPTVKAFAKTNLPTCSVGEVLKSDGTSFSCVTDAGGWTASDATTSAKGIVQISATGGIDVNAGVIQLSDVGTSGDYYKVHTDAKGRVVSGSAALVEADIPTLSTAGKVSGSAINTGTISGNTNVNTTGSIYGNVVSTQNLRIFESTNTTRVNISSPSGVANYSLTLPTGLPGVSGQVLSSDTSGNLSWITPGGGGTVTSVTSGGLPIVVGGTATAPTVSVNAATTSAAGVVQLAANNGTTSGTVVQADDARLTNSRAPSGNAGGDLSGTYPNPTVAQINGQALTYASLTAGDVLKYNGTGWANAALSTANLSDAGDLLKASNMPASCAAGSSLTFSSPTGTWSCTAITVDASNFANQAQNAVFAGPATGGAGAPSFRSLVTADIPSLDWSKITSGKPTTLAGYSISDAVKNDGTTPSIQSGTFASMPTAATAGRLYVTTDTKKVYRDNGSSWDLISASSAGTVTSVTSAGTPIVVAGTATDPTISVSNASTSAKGVVQLATSSDTSAGLVVQANDSRLTDGRAPTGNATGDLSGTYPAPTVSGISGKPVVYSSITSGQYLKYDGANIVNSNIAISDVANLSTQLSNKLDASNMPANCAAGSSLTFSSPTGTWSCTTITVTAGAFGSQAQNTFLASPNGSSGAPTFRTIAAADLPASASYWTAATGGINFAGGNVGIGTTAPAAKLSVSANSAALPSPIAGGVLQVSNADGTAVSIEEIGFGASANLNLRRANGTAASPSALVAGDNLGQLQFTGYGATSYNTSSAAKITAIAAENWTDSTLAGALLFWTRPSGVASASSERMRIDQNGNIGIGTAAPNALLDVTSASPTALVNSTSGTGWAVLGLGYNGARKANFGYYPNNGSNGYTQVSTDAAEPLILGTNGAERVRILSNGNVGIGTTAPQAKLHVSGGQFYVEKATQSWASSTTISFDNGNVQDVTLGGATTFSFSNPKPGATYILIVKQDATGSRTVTWPATVKWPGGVAPVLTSTASAVDIITFVSDGTNYYGLGFAADAK